MTLFRRHFKDPNPVSTRGTLRLLVTVVCLMVFTERSHGQTLGDANAEIQISLENMGIEGSFRPGTYVPIRLNISNRLDAPTPVQIVFEVPNNDGDIEQYSRAAVLSPGQPTLKWLIRVLFGQILPSR